jgi:hypothetical protein
MNKNEIQEKLESGVERNLCPTLTSMEAKEGTRGERKGTRGKGLGFWNGTTWEIIQILGFSIPLRY